MPSNNTLKRKGDNTTRIMTWNAHGLDDKQKRTKLDKFVEEHKIDVLIVQEGNNGYHNPVTEAFEGATEFRIDQTNEEMKLLFSNKTTLKGNGGTQRKTPYNLKYDPTKWTMAKDTEEVDYSKSEAIQRWVNEPVQKAKQKGEIEIAGTGKRRYLKAKRGLEVLAELRDEVQTRVNMFSQQRPKCLKSLEDDRKIYVTHSPLGGTVKLSDIGLDHVGTSNFTGVGAFGSGGELAPAANVLFRMSVSDYDGQNKNLKPLPDNVIYLGDTNVREGGMKSIFAGSNIATSGDGLCHIVTNYNMDLVSNKRDEVNVGTSDHDWVIADIENPK